MSIIWNSLLIYTLQMFATFIESKLGLTTKYCELQLFLINRLYEGAYWAAWVWYWKLLNGTYHHGKLIILCLYLMVEAIVAEFVPLNFTSVSLVSSLLRSFRLNYGSLRGMRWVKSVFRNRSSAKLQIQWRWWNTTWSILIFSPSITWSTKKCFIRLTNEWTGIHFGLTVFSLCTEVSINGQSDQVENPHHITVGHTRLNA